MNRGKSKQNVPSEWLVTEKTRQCACYHVILCVARTSSFMKGLISLPTRITSSLPSPLMLILLYIIISVFSMDRWPMSCCSFSWRCCSQFFFLPSFFVVCFLMSSTGTRYELVSAHSSPVRHPLLVCFSHIHISPLSHNPHETRTLDRRDKSEQQQSNCTALQSYSLPLISLKTPFN